MNIKITSELVEGDIVLCHGMRCMIDRPIQVSKSHPVASDGSVCRYTAALVLNRDEVSRDAVPYGYTVQHGEPGTHRWTIQGNDLARWAVEG